MSEAKVFKFRSKREHTVDSIKRLQDNAIQHGDQVRVVRMLGSVGGSSTTLHFELEVSQRHPGDAR